MTIDVVQNLGSTVQYIASAGQTVFPVPFPFVNNTDIVVQAALITLANGTDYTVSGAGNDTGGTVTLAIGAVVNTVYTITRNIAIQRLTEYQQNGPFTSAAINAELDNIILIEQQLRDAISRCLQLPVTNSPAPTTTLTPTNYAGAYLSFDSNGNPVPTVLTSTGAITGPIIGGLLYARTTAEVAASVTPTSFVYPELDPRRYGVDTTGSTSTVTAFNTLLSVAAQYGGVILRMPQGAAFRFDTGLSFDINKVGIDLNGATFDFSRMTTGHAIQFTNSNADVNLGPLAAATHPLSNGTLVGPGANIAAVDAFFFSGVSTNGATAIKCRNLSVRDFFTDITFGNQAFCISFISCEFTAVNGTTTAYSVIQQNATNTGERNTFIDCQWFNKPLLIQNLSSGGSDIYAIGCSFDYFTTAFSVTGGGGSIVVNGSHIESNTDAANWGIATGASSILIISGCTIAMTGAKTAFDLFFSSSTTTNGGVFIRDCIYGPGANTMTTFLIGGTGAARVENLIQANAGAHPPLSTSLNLLAWGGFESANFSAEWTLTGSPAAARSTTVAHSGTESLGFVGTSGNNPSAAAVVPCKPGQYFQGQYWYIAPAFTGTGVTFFSQIDYLDKSGNSLGAVVVTTVTTTVSSWTRAGFTFQTPAPAGTVSARLTWSMFGATSGAPIGYIDDVVLGVM